MAKTPNMSKPRISKTPQVSFQTLKTYLGGGGSKKNNSAQNKLNWGSKTFKIGIQKNIQPQCCKKCSNFLRAQDPKKIRIKKKHAHFHCLDKFSASHPLGYESCLDTPQRFLYMRSLSRQNLRHRAHHKVIQP